MERYVINGYTSAGDVAYTVIVNTEKEMIQEVKDGLNDGFAVYVVKQVLIKGNNND